MRLNQRAPDMRPGGFLFRAHVALGLFPLVLSVNRAYLRSKILIPD